MALPRDEPYTAFNQDIMDLVLSDIDWIRNAITFKYTKTGNEKARPLTERVHYALLDYMKEERPEASGGTRPSETAWRCRS